MFYAAGNPALQPEFFGKYELGYLLKKHQFTLYFNNVKDAINGIYLLDGEVTTYQQFNNGAQRQYGLTYNWTGQLFDWWYFSPSGNVFYREFINEDNVSMFGQTSYRLKVNNNFKINKTTSIDFAGRYISPKKDAFYEAAARYEANIIFKKSFLHKKLNARIYIHDIFNTRRFINRRPFADFETRNDRNPRSTGVTFYLAYHFSNNHKTSDKTNRSGNDAVDRL
ncbi:MAG: outer membrane beta-barrel protein [Bacteroidota bacterium]